MSLRYNKVIGIGGIGTGILFHTDDNRTLGKSESRLVELSDAKDYCKLHIVFHYISTLISPSVKIYPVGYVGKDSSGAALLDEMKQAGMDVTYVSKDNTLPTMISVCLQYPDNDGCNFTVSNSACDQVTPEYVEHCMKQIAIDNGTIVAAIPEVRLQSRVKMLRYGKEQGAFCVLSVPEAEAEDFKQAEIFDCCDLLAVNNKEALALAPGEEEGKAITERLYAYLCAYNPEIMLLVTCGKLGAYSGYHGQIEYVPNSSTDVVNTTGAGDACLGGTIAGLVLRMPFQKSRNDRKFGETPLSSAVELGALCAGMAIETADSIAHQVNATAIIQRIEQQRWERESWFIK